MSIATRPVQHPDLPELPDHLPVLVHPELVDLGWVALHRSRLFGVAGKRLTPKHHRPLLPLRGVYRLAPTTKLAVEEADLSTPTECATTAALEATGQ